MMKDEMGRDMHDMHIWDGMEKGTDVLRLSRRSLKHGEE